MPFADAALASLAVRLGVKLWTQDGHFLAMQQIIPQLKLFQPALEN